MKISGFTMVRNATQYYFPIQQSIASALPLVDEYIVALGKGSDFDTTREEILALNNPKIKIIDRVWNEADYANSKVFADETTYALSQCTGDWCLYLQADEVLHENDLNNIKSACQLHLNNPKIDGLLFNYHHFWGDYHHHLPYHGWYKNEIRVVRNNAHIYSYKDAQSFRKNGNKKLHVAPIDARIFHYGWVRPPHTMKQKKVEHDSIHHPDRPKTNDTTQHYNYGAMGKLPIYTGTHPACMQPVIDKMSWAHTLNYTKKATLNRPKMKHERLKYIVITWIENALNITLGGYQNWHIVR